MATLTGGQDRYNLMPMFTRTRIEMSTGEAIKRSREKKGWSQEKLARFVGTRQETISAYERDIAKPNVELAIAIAEVLGLDDWMSFRRAFQKKTA